MCVNCVIIIILLSYYTHALTFISALPSELFVYHRSKDEIENKCNSQLIVNWHIGRIWFSANSPICCVSRFRPRVLILYQSTQQQQMRFLMVRLILPNMAISFSLATCDNLTYAFIHVFIEHLTVSSLYRVELYMTCDWAFTKQVIDNTCSVFRFLYPITKWCNYLS